MGRKYKRKLRSGPGPVVEFNIPLALKPKKMRVSREGDRVKIPERLREIYLLRQRQTDIRDCIIYAREGEDPILAVLKEVPSKEESHLYELTELGTPYGEFKLPKNPNSTRDVIFIGQTDHVDIVEEKNFWKYMESYNSLTS